MNLTVFGATGGVGHEVVTQALAAGHHVTAYVRNPARLELNHPELTVAAGELTDREAIQQAVSGADAVISALGPSLDRKATEMLLIEGTRNIVEAMQAAGVERYIGMATPKPARPARRGQPARPRCPVHGPHLPQARVPRAAGDVADRD